MKRRNRASRRGKLKVRILARSLSSEYTRAVGERLNRPALTSSPNPSLTAAHVHSRDQLAVNPERDPAGQADSQGLQQRKRESRESAPRTRDGSKRRRRASQRAAGVRLHFLTSEDVDAIHYALVEAYRASEDPIESGIRGSGELLESAVMRPMTAWQGVRKYKGVHEAAAALTHSLVHNHPFVDGNKRTATVGLLAFLNRNKKTLFVATNDELFDEITALARHELARSNSSGVWLTDPDIEVKTLAKWLKAKIDSRYRPLVARKFFAILERRGCTIDRSRQGNQVTISRLRQRAGKRLVTHISVRGDGQELTRKTIRKACLELELGHADGFDIYSEVEAAEFISDWRDILDRLGELDRGM